MPSFGAPQLSVNCRGLSPLSSVTVHSDRGMLVSTYCSPSASEKLADGPTDRHTAV